MTPGSSPIGIVLIEAYGDDSMYGVNPDTGAAYADNAPADLQALLRARFGDRVTVSNQGAKGSTLSTLISGSDGRHLPIEQQMSQSQARIVLVNHGVNDSAAGGETTSQFWSLLTQFVSVASNHGKIIVLEEPGPVCSSNYNVQPYAAITDAVAHQSGAALVSQYQSLLAMPDYCSHLAGQYYPDQYIYGIKAQHEAAALIPIIERLLE